MYSVFRQFPDKDSEINYIIKLIDRLSKNYKLGDIAVIPRKNGRIKEFGNYISNLNIPFKIMSKSDGYEFGDE